ncbi:MAG: aminoglycoside phosphotransferase family protein [Deltaproteobacteria bacterium]|nr:aminoglycoside phosphotransferase family protein [Deltaproteobacteria bacterium]
MRFKVASYPPLLTTEQIQEIEMWINNYSRNVKTLSGREGCRIIEGQERLHVKICSAGGLFSKAPFIVRCTIGFRKCDQEVRTLRLAYRVGIQAPELVGKIVCRAGIFKLGLIVTKYIEGLNLIELAKSNQAVAKKCFGELEREIKKLFKHRLFHKDLHPGNVVVDNYGKVYLVDWASVSPRFVSQSTMAVDYTNRWRRACIKYKLPGFLISYFCEMMARLQANDSLY